MRALVFAWLTVVKVACGEDAACDAFGEEQDLAATPCIRASPLEGTGLLQIQTTSATGSLLLQGLEPVKVETHEDILLIPKPQELNVPPSRRVFAVQSFLLVAEDNLKPRLGFMQSVQELFKMTDSAPVLLEGSSGSRLQMHLLPPPKIQHAHTKEEYELSVASQGVDISANTEQGLFNGLMTLRQLVRKQEGPQNASRWTIPEVQIQDSPQMVWRGMMLDVARHFYSAPEVKRFLSLMAMFKFNRFHWHLTDDQGWRFPVDKWPKLTSVGQWRAGTPFDEATNARGKTDHETYGGSYTKEDIQDVVRHAESLFIEVIPELDVPGHTQSAIAAYPKLGNKDKPMWRDPKVAEAFGPSEYTLAPTNESFQFVRDCVDAMATLIPGPHLHIGGDEVPLDQWKLSKQAMNFLGSHQMGIAQTPKLQNFFEEVGIAQVKSHSRRPIVWEEAASRGVSKAAIVMVWLPAAKPVLRVGELTGKGYDVVLSPSNFVYFDYAESDHDEYPAPQLATNRRYSSLSQVYSMAIPPSAGTGRVLGGQANVWTEYIRDSKQLDYRVWPRACALADRLWIGGATSNKRDFQDFKNRLQPTLLDLETAGVYFRPLDSSSEL
mmetsp:Transcript_35362/g.64724  ORF Transcript_35362/g.64724 Transcript_35362/m.64724 type:complete len:607 (-) Transcript_35362:50-1870(-)